jgi:hypothetical protein
MPRRDGLVGSGVSLFYSQFPISFLHSGQRIKTKLRSGELIIPGDQWPAFLYAGQNFDCEDPWKGLFMNSILISVSRMKLYMMHPSETDMP